MKTPISLVALLVIALALVMPTSAQSTASPSKTDLGYALGLLVGNNFLATGVEIDIESAAAGLRDSLGKKTPKMTPDVANSLIQTAVAEVQAKVAAANAAAEKDYLAANGKKPGVKTTASGLQYKVVTEGTGPKPALTDVVSVDYVGTFTDGTTFDSSIARGEPATFPLENVIPGWTEGLQLVNVGGSIELTIPSALAYGPDGSGDGAIPGNATLIFSVSLLSIEPPEAP
jgi:FKBP-type peptidyl-prolyl cis-trans isomerase